MPGSPTSSKMMQFTEIEHKFLVGNSFAKEAFFAQIKQLRPDRSSEITVQDTYYLLKDNPSWVYRHRLDEEIQQLSVKSRGGDAEHRAEIDLNLGLGFGDQSKAVERFLKSIGVVWQGVIKKHVWAFYFSDCEIVYYEASSACDHVCCVEFEARNCRSVEQSLQVIDSYESRLGFEKTARCKASLFDLLLDPSSAQNPDERRC